LFNIAYYFNFVCKNCYCKDALFKLFKQGQKNEVIGLKLTLF